MRGNRESNRCLPGVICMQLWHFRTQIWKHVYIRSVLTMLSHWRRWVLCQEAHSEPSENHCTGCRYLAAQWKTGDITHATHGCNIIEFIVNHCLTLLIHKNWGCTKRCNRVNQKEAVISAGDMTTVRNIKYDMIFGGYMKPFCTQCLKRIYIRRLTFCRCLQCRLLGDRGQRRTLHVWGKTGQACVFLRPRKIGKKKGV